MSLQDTWLVSVNLQKLLDLKLLFSWKKHTKQVSYQLLAQEVITFLQRFNSFLSEDGGWSSLAGIFLQACFEDLGRERPTVRRDLSQWRRLVGNLKALQREGSNQGLESHEEEIW